MLERRAIGMIVIQYVTVYNILVYKKARRSGTTLDLGIECTVLDLHEVGGFSMACNMA